MFSPDGTRLVTGGEDATLRVWDVHTDPEMSILPQKSEPVLALAFPDKNKVISIRGKSIVTLDVSTGHVLSRPLSNYPRPTRQTLPAATISNTGKHLAVAGKYGSIHIWNVDTGALLHGDDEDRPSRADMFSLAFSFDDSSIICGDASGQIEIYRISDGTLLHRFPDAHSGPVSGVALTPDGKRIASCSWEKTLHIWDVDSDRDSSVAVRLESSLGYAICVALTSDGGCAVAGSVHSGGIAVWDVQTGALAEEEIAASGNSPAPKFCLNGKSRRRGGAGLRAA